LEMYNSEKDVLTSGRRDRVEIIAAIAAMTQKPSKITRIMSQVNLSYPLLKNILKLMLRLRLIETRKVTENGIDKGQIFQATEKGLTFLKTYCDLLRIIYGEEFLQKHNNLAVACLKYCKVAE
jgi:predicted transcriptional regulator